MKVFGSRMSFVCVSKQTSKQGETSHLQAFETALETMLLFQAAELTAFVTKHVLLCNKSIFFWAGREVQNLETSYKMGPYRPLYQF